jgi:hypothetical protein
LNGGAPQPDPTHSRTAPAHTRAGPYTGPRCHGPSR